MRWQRDGWDARWRIGVLVPHADLGPESELAAMAPPDVSIHATRVPFGAIRAGGGLDPTIPLAPVRAFAEPPHVDDAAELLAAAPLHAIGFGFTSSAYVIGADEERAMVERLTERARRIPVVTPCAGAVEALRLLGAERIALIDPPWFDAELNGLGRSYYEGAGFDVVLSSPAGLPSDQEQITPEALFDFVVDNVPASAQAIVLGGNGFRSVGVVQAVEEHLGKPFIPANAALFWAALRAAGAPTSLVIGYGRIFHANRD